MAKYLLDTNICVWIMRGKHNLHKTLREVGIKNCKISEISYAELLYGAACCERPEETYRMVVEFCEDIGIVPISDSLHEFAILKAELRRKGTPIDDFDLLIASCAKANGFVMVTDNLKHFNRIPNLTVQNWVER